MQAACLQHTKAIRECYDTDKRFDALKLTENTKTNFLYVATWRMIDIALLRTYQLRVVQISVSCGAFRNIYYNLYH